MDWADRVVKLMRKFTKELPGLQDGMHHAAEVLSTARSGQVVEKVAEIDWAADLEPFGRWVRRSVSLRPLPADVRGLWFCVPEIDLNPPDLYFIGCGGFDERDGSEWASEPTWTQDQIKGSKSRASRHPAEYRLRALAACQRVLTVGPGTNPAPDERDLVENLYSGFPLVYIYLLLRHAMPSIVDRLIDEETDWRGVGYGYADGDQCIAGVLTKDGWTKPGKRYRADAEAPVCGETPDPRLDPSSDEFRLSAYLASGRDINARDESGYTPLHAACSVMDDHNWRLISQMIDAGADINAKAPSGYTPMFDLVNAPIALLRRCLEMGGRVDVRNEMQHTPLHAAIGMDANPAKLKVILESGVNPNLKGLSGRTPLHAIADYGMPDYDEESRTARNCIRLLVNHGANLEAKDEYGATPLMHAVHQYAACIHSDSPSSTAGHDRVALEFLRAGSNADCAIKHSRDPLIPSGGTPLMCQRYGDGSLHLALLTHGADPKRRCPKGKTALDYAANALKKPGKRRRDGIARVVKALRERV